MSSGRIRSTDDDESSPKRWISNLPSQHRRDIAIYKSAHREWRNRWIHYGMVPLEYLTFMLVLMVLSNSGTLVTVVGIVLARLSLFCCTSYEVGLAAAIYHFMSGPMVYFVTIVVMENNRMNTLGIAAVVWTIAWTLQVGVGHWMCERNSSNLANPSEVSALAVCLSVLIAWSV